MTDSFWRGRRVFMTGHTGFKGGWLSLWLAQMGAEVHGYALAPPTDPSFFSVCRLSQRLAASTIADINDAEALAAAIERAQPEVVFHLAAQSLVRASYREPLETYAVNVMGTVRLLEAVRRAASVRAVVNVTSDKCYENTESDHPYREGEPLGGHDPYSSSKACSELITAAYRRSFLEPAGVHVASARAGNVIGGGDWAVDRLLPDFLRAIAAGQKLSIRSPRATRPWQHVLEPLAGYLCLAERLVTAGASAAGPWNFGPNQDDARSVQWVVEQLCCQVEGAKWQLEPDQQPHEAQALTLDSTKARAVLGWQPKWNLETALEKTLHWHREWQRGSEMSTVSLDHIVTYVSGR